MVLILAGYRYIGDTMVRFRISGCKKPLSQKKFGKYLYMGNSTPFGEQSPMTFGRCANLGGAMKKFIYTRKIRMFSLNFLRNIE